MTPNPENPDYSLTTFDYVVVEKEKLLSKLRENREGHNAIYEAAVSGYWVEAQRVLNEKKIQFDTAVTKVTTAFSGSFERRNVAITEKNLKGISSFSTSFEFNAHWPLAYPTNRLEDYDRVISMLEFSVADKVQLKSSDFDCYVRNNWSWTQSFASSNQNYVQCVTGLMALNRNVYDFACSGASALTYR